MTAPEPMAPLASGTRAAEILARLRAGGVVLALTPEGEITAPRGLVLLEHARREIAENLAAIVALLGAEADATDARAVGAMTARLGADRTAWKERGEPRPIPHIDQRLSGAQIAELERARFAGRWRS